MEGFNEQVVKRTNNLKHTLIKVLSILLLITVPLTCVLLAGIITSYLAVVGFFLLIAGIYVVWYVFSSWIILHYIRKSKENDRLSDP